MCRSIQQLRGAEPPATDEEVRDAALQFVRKISGYRRPSAANEAVFEAAVDRVAAATRELLDGLQVGPGSKPATPVRRSLEQPDMSVALSAERTPNAVPPSTTVDPPSSRPRRPG